MVEVGGSGASEVTGLEYEETELKLGPPGQWAAPASPDGERKRGFEMTLGSVGESDSGESSVVSPAAKAQVVGWPPVGSFRKNALKTCKFVKVAVDGAPYLRKVDLEKYGGYVQLLTALEEMFSCFTVSYHLPKERRLLDPVNRMEYVPTYEDKDGDWMLIGDVPWKIFVESCLRLRLMKMSDVKLATRSPMNAAARSPQTLTNAK